MNAFLWTIAAISYAIALISLIGAMATQSVLHFISTTVWLLLAIVSMCGAGILERLHAIHKSLSQPPK